MFIIWPNNKLPLGRLLSA